MDFTHPRTKSAINSFLSTYHCALQRGRYIWDKFHADIDPEGDRIFPSQQPQPLSLALEMFDLDLSAYVHLKSAGKNSTSGDLMLL